MSLCCVKLWHLGSQPTGRLLRVMYFRLILICFFICSTLSIDSKKKSQFCCELTSTFSSILDPAFLLLVSLDPNKRILGQCFPSLIQCTRSQWQGFCLDRIGLHRGILDMIMKIGSSLHLWAWWWQLSELWWLCKGDCILTDQKEKVGDRWCPSSSFCEKMQARWGFNWP